MMAAPPWPAVAASFGDGTVCGAPVVGTPPPDDLVLPPVLVLDCDGYVAFSWKMPGRTELGREAVCDDEEELLVELEELLDVLAGAGADDEEAAGGGCWTVPVEPSVLKMTMLAVSPLGTVTTQKSAPPAPVAARSLLTLKPSTVAGLISHGSPLQRPDAHSILMPNVGRLSLSGESMKMGFHPSLTYVSPVATVFAPATYGLQLPTGLL